MFHPTRGGTRGGRDQFKWDDVKGMEYKDREMYLGWGDFLGRSRWYRQDSNGKTSEKASKDEIDEVKRREEEMMMQALGMDPNPNKINVARSVRLEKHELKELTRRGASEKPELVGERAEGLGFAPAAKHEVGTGSKLPQQQQPERESDPQKRRRVEDPARNEGTGRVKPAHEYTKEREERKHEHKSRRRDRHSSEREDRRRHRKHHDRRRSESSSGRKSSRSERSSRDRKHRS